MCLGTEFYFLSELTFLNVQARLQHQSWTGLVINGSCELFLSLLLVMQLADLNSYHWKG